MEGGLGLGVSVIEPEAKAAMVSVLPLDEDGLGQDDGCPGLATAEEPDDESESLMVMQPRPSFCEAENRMGEAMIEMIAEDEAEEERREQQGDQRKSGKGVTRGVPGDGSRGPPSPLGFDGVGFEDALSADEDKARNDSETGDEEEDEAESGMDFLRSLVVRLMLHSAETGTTVHFHGLSFVNILHLMRKGTGYPSPVHRVKSPPWLHKQAEFFSHRTLGYACSTDQFLPLFDVRVAMILQGAGSTPAWPGTFSSSLVQTCTHRSRPTATSSGTSTAAR
jgi:hypothetical protein